MSSKSMSLKGKIKNYAKNSTDGEDRQEKKKCRASEDRKASIQCTWLQS